MKLDKQKTKNHFKKHWAIYAIGFLMILAFILRIWHLQENLYFSLDQARDAEMVKNAYSNGTGDLPLLGPRAAGTLLRMGPIFYYFQFVSTKVFNSVEPYVLVYPDLLLSILTIPLLYYFFRQFFPRTISLIIATLYGFSFIITQYSRFAWNTNSIPFWGLLFILGIYKSVNLENKKQAGWWLVLAGLSYGVVSQLHFIALVGFPAIAVLFWIFYRPKKINWKYWLLALVAVAVLYTPMIVSEIKTKGYNLEQFGYALSHKTAKAENEDGEKTKKTPLIKKINKININLGMLTSSVGNKDSLLALYGGSLLVVVGLALFVRKWRKDKTKRKIILLTTIWFFIFYLILLITDTSLKPRFFLPIAVIPFVFIGAIIDFLWNLKNKPLKITSTVIFGLFLLGLLIMNLGAIKMWYAYIENQDSSAIKRDIFLKQSDGMTLGNMKKINSHMVNQAEKNNRAICYNVKNEYVHTFEYLLVLNHPEIKQFRIKRDLANKNQCQFFSIASTGDNKKKISNKYINDFSFIGQQEFGLVTAWDIQASEDFINNKDVDDDRVLSKHTNIANPERGRLFWKNVFEK